MQPFYAIYNKGTSLQFAFNDNLHHPRYIGAEFPVGHSLTAAINIKPDEATIVLKNFIRTYINYLNEKKSVESYDKFENALFDADSYCIYLRGIVHKLIEMINKLHPRYAPSYLTHFINDFNKEQITLLLESISKIKEEPEQADNKLYFWNLCAKFMLDTFSNDIKYLKSDIYDLCNVTDGYTGKSRLHSLDNIRKNFYIRMIFNCGSGTSVGEAENSKIFVSSPLENDEIIDAVYADTILEFIYYEFNTVLKNNLPIKLCKNCNLPFVPKGRIDSLYCERFIPEAKARCSDVGANNTYKNNLSDTETEFYAARRRYNTRVSRNPLLKTEFEVWKIKAKQKLIAYRDGKISADEFKEWFMDDEWTKN